MIPHSSQQAQSLRTLQIGDDWIEDRPGGLGRYFYELVNHLPATGTCAHGLVLGTDRVSAATNSRIVAFARRNDPLPKRMSQARSVSLTIMREQQVNLIASHFAVYALPLIDRFRSTPLVVHFHGPWAAESDAEQSSSINLRVKSAIENLVYTRARRCIVLSQSFKREMIERYRLSEEKIRVVPGGIDQARFNTTLTRAEARHQLGWPVDRPIIFTVRRLVRRVGLENFIDAARLVLQCRPDALFLLGGSGPLAKDLQLRIANYGLEESIRLLGRVDDLDLPAAYRAADFTVVPSQSLEGFGLTTLESLASGTPVFVTPIGGLPEILQPLAPQCIFADTSTQAIADRLSDALDGSCPMPSDDECRAYAVSNFSWQSIAQQVRDVYLEALQ